MSQGLVRKFTGVKTRNYSIDTPDVYTSIYDFLEKTFEKNNSKLNAGDRYIARNIQFFLTYIVPVNPAIAYLILKYSPEHQGYIE